MNNSTNDVNQVAKRPIILAGAALLAVAVIIAIVLGVRVSAHGAALEASAKNLTDAEAKVSTLTDEVAAHVETNAALTDENASLTEAKTALEAEKEGWAAEKSTFEGAKAALEGEKAGLEEAVATHAQALTDAESKLSDAESKVNAAQTQLETTAADHLAQVTGLNDQLSTLQSSLDAAETAHAETKSALDEANKSLEDASGNHNLLSERIKSLDSEVFKLQNDAANKQARIAELEGIQSTQQTRNDKGLHASLSVKDSQIAALQSAVDAHKEKADAHAAENEELKAHIKNLEDSLGMGMGHGPAIPEAVGDDGIPLGEEEKLPDGAQENSELPE